MAEHILETSTYDKDQLSVLYHGVIKAFARANLCGPKVHITEAVRAMNSTFYSSKNEVDLSEYGFDDLVFRGVSEHIPGRLSKTEVLWIQRPSRIFMLQTPKRAATPEYTDYKQSFQGSPYKQELASFMQDIVIGLELSYAVDPPSIVFRREDLCTKERRNGVPPIFNRVTAYA